jgi:hypothetical protein
LKRTGLIEKGSASVWGGCLLLLKLLAEDDFWEHIYALDLETLMSRGSSREMDYKEEPCHPTSCIVQIGFYCLKNKSEKKKREEEKEEENNNIPHSNNLNNKEAINLFKKASQYEKALDVPSDKKNERACLERYCYYSLLKNCNMKKVKEVENPDLSGKVIEVPTAAAAINQLCSMQSLFLCFSPSLCDELWLAQAMICEGCQDRDKLSVFNLHAMMSRMVKQLDVLFIDSGISKADVPEKPIPCTLQFLHWLFCGNSGIQTHTAAEDAKLLLEILRECTNHLKKTNWEEEFNRKRQPLQVCVISIFSEPNT